MFIIAGCISKIGGCCQKFSLKNPVQSYKNYTEEVIFLITKVVKKILRLRQIKICEISASTSQNKRQNKETQ